MEQDVFPTRKEALDHALNLDCDRPAKRLSKTLRMPFVWVLWQVSEEDTYIVCVHLYKVESNWTYSVQGEGHFTELTCPIKYLASAEPIIDDAWRAKVIGYFYNRRKLFNDIKNIFSVLDDGKVIKVFLKPGWRPVSDLIVESNNPLVGRQDGLGPLYRIKPIAIERYEIIGVEDDSY